jgi:hypothetical protein
MQTRYRTPVPQFGHDDTRVLTRIPTEKTSNRMKVIRWQLPSTLLFAGRVHRYQGMTLQRAVIDCRRTFRELCVGFSGGKSHADLCILLPPDIEAFTIRPPVDLGIVQTLETASSSNAPPTTPPLPGNNVKADPSSLEGPDSTHSGEFPCPDDYSDAPEDQTDSLCAQIRLAWGTNFGSRPC